MSCNNDCNQGRNCDCGGLHLVPVDDLKEHVLRKSCWCRPEIDEENNVIVHNSLDGREDFETGRRKPS